MILLEIDPHRAHAYWNIDPAESDPSRPLVLRVYDITGAGAPGQANQSFDVEVHGLQGRWYLDFWRDDRTFVTEIGYRNPDGTLKVLARSNEITTPPAEAKSATPEVEHLDPHGNPVHTEWPGAQAPESKPADRVEEPASVTEPAAVSVEPVTLLEPVFPVADWPAQPTAESLEEPSEAGPTEPAAARSASAEAAGEAPVAFSGDEEPRGAAAGSFPSPEALRDSVSENREAIKAYYDAVAALPPPGPATSRDVPRHEPEPTPAPSAGSPPTAPAIPAPLEQIVGLSSLEPAGRDVLLEVNAELHIYGRSKPNTELTLYGQVVKTRPDGTFSVRRILPHGAVVLPLLYTRKKD